MNIKKKGLRCKKREKKCRLNSVADPFDFDTDPDLRIHSVEKRLRIRSKIDKMSTFISTLFSSDYPKNYLLLYKYKYKTLYIYIIYIYI